MLLSIPGAPATAHVLQYLGGEPCAICGHRLEVAPTQAGAAPAAPPPKPPSAFPSEIVPGFLFLGSYDHASRHEILKTLGIGYILNVGAWGVAWVGDNGWGTCMVGRAGCRMQPAGMVGASPIIWHFVDPLSRGSLPPGVADRAQLPGAVPQLVHLPHSERQPATAGRVCGLPRCVLCALRTTGHSGVALLGAAV